MKTKKVAIIGRGAIGALYCARFTESGVSVRILGNTERLERYKQEGLFFNGKEVTGLEFKGDGKVDLVIIATKWDGFQDALNRAKEVMGTGTVVLPLLNGVLPYELAVRTLGKESVKRGFFLGATAVREGNSVNMKGSYNTVMEGCEWVERLFDECGISYRVEKDMQRESWQKLTVNIGFNQVSALEGGITYAQIRDSSEHYKMAEGLMKECGQVAKLLGVNGAEEMAQKGMAMLDILNPEDYTSMAQDIRAKRETEWPIFGKFLIEEAKKFGVELPVHQEFKRQLGV